MPRFNSAVDNFVHRAGRQQAFEQRHRVSHQSDRVAQLWLIAGKSVAHFFHHRLRSEGKASGDARIFYGFIALRLVDVIGKAGADRPGSIRLT